MMIGCGLLNIGNSCFFNATLQALFHTPAIADILWKDPEASDRSECKCFLCAIVSLFRKTQCRSLPYDPSQLYENIKKTNLRFAFLLNGLQQDAHEFLMVLMEMTNGSHSDLSFMNEFNADIVTETECSICKTVYKTPGIVGSFELDIQGKKSIQMALQSYFDCDICDYKCEACGKKTVAKKQSLLASLPRCLCILLKRFTVYGKKLEDDIEITPELAMSKYFSEKQAKEWNYKLVAVINHFGNTPYNGHYSTIACIENECYSFNDEKVHITTANEVSSGNAYVLLYEITKESIDMLSDGDLISIIDENEIAQEQAEFIMENDVFDNQEPEEINTFDDLEQFTLVEIVDEDEIEDPTMDHSDEYNENKETDSSDNNCYEGQSLNEESIDMLSDGDLISIIDENEIAQEQAEFIMENDVFDNQEPEEINTFDDLEQFTLVEIVDEDEIEDPTMDHSDEYNENKETDSSDNNCYEGQSLNEELKNNLEFNQERIPIEFIDEVEVQRVSQDQGDLYVENEIIDSEDHQELNENQLTGRRVVDIYHVFKQTQGMTNNICKACSTGEMVFTREVKRGLASTFTFRCTFCGIMKRIDACPKNDNSASINQASVLGIVSIGLGCYQLQEFFAHLDVPCMSYPTFHKLEKSIQADWWKLAKKFEADALQEEIRLAKESNEVDSAGNAKIVVEFDCSWGKRSYGKNFSSLSGCAAIIGLKTNKILYSDVKNKYCHICKIAQSKTTPPNQHECNKNYDGPSSGMETEIIVEGFKYCAEKGARFHQFIGDGDSSTYKALRDLNLYRNPELAIEKFDCVNHLHRNYIKAFDVLLGNTKFKLKGRKLLSTTLGRNISIGVRSSAQHWKEADIDPVDKYANLERDVMNAPLHYLGNHDRCEKYFCTKTTEPVSHSIIAILKETGVYYEILDLCQRYFANNAKSLIAGLCTNKVEGFNSLIAKTLGNNFCFILLIPNRNEFIDRRRIYRKINVLLGGKRVCNALGGSYKMRTNISEVQFNTKGYSGSTFHELIFRNDMISCVKLENTRKRKVEKNAIALKTKPKKRRIERENTKKKVTRKLYSTGREEVDMEASKFDLAKNRLLERLGEDQINRSNVKIETRGQRNSLKWMQIRKRMVTSSYFGRILNVKSRKSYKNIVYDIIHRNEQYSNTAAMRHQRMLELEALEYFRDLYSHDSIEKCGIFIDAEFCFLGASPFRLYGEDGIIIVKCPKNAFKKSFDKAIEKNLILFWIGSPNNMRVNFKSHWYFEIQGQLRITGKRIAYLVVYLGESVCRIQEVERNDYFWKSKMQGELIFFFEEALLKEIVDSRVERSMDIREYNAKTKTFV